MNGFVISIAKYKREREREDYILKWPDCLDTYTFSKQITHVIAPVKVVSPQPTPPPPPPQKKNKARTVAV